MMLQEIEVKVPSIHVLSQPDCQVLGVSIDSREVKEGDLFVAISGVSFDGSEFIEDARSKGAVAIAAEKGFWKEDPGYPALEIQNVRKTLGFLSAEVYGQPSQKLKAIGVTGTNGKTTFTYLMESILEEAELSPGILGTVNYRWKGKVKDAERTTPEANLVQSNLREMVDDGCQSVVMECSSNAIEVGRVNGVDFDLCVFTNLSQDHLDLHGTLQEYEIAKRGLFDRVLTRSSKTNRVAVLNIDDPVGLKWSKEFSGQVYRYSTRDEAEARATKVDLSMDGIVVDMQLRSRKLSIHSKLIGHHNVENLLAAAAAADVLGLSDEAIKNGLEKVHRIPGRLERVELSGSKRFVFVDYAHTDHALENVLRTLRASCQGRLMVVFGCGGDRDRGKRPKMAAAVCQYADVVLVTSDNPRSEDPEKILDDIVKGMSPDRPLVSIGELSGSSHFVSARMANRETAIAKMIGISEEADVILIAGKGHETYQESKGVKTPFDDRKIATKYLEGETV